MAAEKVESLTWSAVAISVCGERRGLWQSQFLGLLEAFGGDSR